MLEPTWLQKAREFIGLYEKKGAEHNPQILAWWKAIKLGGIKDDETPWCAAFVGGVLESVGIQSSRSGAARSYLQWGQPIKLPVPGCVVVFSRDGGGHVGFVVGKDSTGRLLVLGGNQADAVNVRAFGLDRVLGYRWPTLVALPAEETLPVLSPAQVSTTEA